LAGGWRVRLRRRRDEELRIKGDQSEDRAIRCNGGVNRVYDDRDVVKERDLVAESKGTSLFLCFFSGSGESSKEAQTAEGVSGGSEKKTRRVSG
jgi:hypothetical protein